MNELRVGIVTGLGEEVGHYFAATFRDHSKKFCRGVLVVEHHVDAAYVIPVLSHEWKVRDILLDAITPQLRPPHELILIPCNSVHIASPYLKQTFGDHFIPIDEAVMSLISREGRKGRFLILGTSTTVKSGMYQEGLRRLGCESLVLPPEVQTEFDDFIFNDLVNGKMDASHLYALRKLEHRYMERLEADHAILACTELCYLV
ncbi:MAG: aspartate/glutamate racemase family protein [Rectinemataceae bacterium]|nr:aspartate/glutamate racemase family protein [Rectinemataceae bacterium]